MATIKRKVFVNKRNKQLSVPLSRKQIKKINPTIRFNEDLFVSLEIFNEDPKKKRKKNE